MFLENFVYNKELQKVTVKFELPLFNQMSRGKCVPVADSTLASEINTGVLIQREPKDFRCLAVLERSSSNLNSILFFLDNATKNDRVSNKINEQ